jgi:hypothetical protein
MGVEPGDTIRSTVDYSRDVQTKRILITSNVDWKTPARFALFQS